MAVLDGSAEARGVGGQRRDSVAPVAPVDRTRFVLGLLAFAAVATGVVVVVRATSGTPLHVPLALALGVVLLPIIAAPIEWIVHRFVYHEPVVPWLRPIFTVHTAHHFAFFPTWRYVTGGPARRLAIRRQSPDVHVSILTNTRVRAAHYAWYMAIGAVVVWTPAWLATSDVAFLVGLIASSAVVSNLFIVVHDTIHRPRSHRIVEAQPWFAFLDRHHWVHHIDLGANLNFLLPLGDLVFGTLRTELTPEELAGHGTLAQAKARAAGAGERARADSSAVPG